MARKHVYTGLYYNRHHRRNHNSNNNMPQRNQPKTTLKNFHRFVNVVSKYVETAYSMMNGNYLALATVFVVVLLSFLIPDISQKIHATNELKNMKKVLNLMTKEVNRAEVACLTAAEEVCYLHCSMHDQATETVSISQETYKTCQSALTAVCDLLSPNQSMLISSLDYCSDYSITPETHLTRKLQSCPTYTRTRLMLKKR